MGNFGSGLVQGMNQAKEMEFKRQEIAAQKQYWGALEKTQNAEAEMKGLQMTQLKDNMRRALDQEAAIRKFLDLGPEQSVPYGLTPPQPDQPPMAPLPGPQQLVPPPRGLRQNLTQPQPEASAQPAAFNEAQPMPAGMPPQPAASDKPQYRGPLGDPRTLKARLGTAYALGGIPGVLEAWKSEVAREAKPMPADSYEVKDFGGKAMIFNKVDGTMKWATDPDGQPIEMNKAGKYTYKEVMNPDGSTRVVAIDSGKPEAGAIEVEGTKGAPKPAMDKQPDFGDAREALAGVLSARKYGEPLSYGQLLKKDQKLAEQVDTEVGLNRPVRVAGAKGAVEIEMALQKPVGKEHDNWLDAKTLQPAKPNMKMGDVQAGAYVHVDDTQKSGLSQVTSVLQNLDKLEEIADRLLRKRYGKGWIDLPTGIAQSVTLQAKELAGDPDAQLAQSLIARSTVPLNKLQGDTANMAVAEREIISKAMFSKSDTVESMRGKIDDIRESLYSSLNRHGFDDAAIRKSHRNELKKGIQVPDFVPEDERDQFRETYLNEMMKMRRRP